MMKIVGICPSCGGNNLVAFTAPLIDHSLFVESADDSVDLLGVEGGWVLRRE